jgi:hypothetical protein
LRASSLSNAKIIDLLNRYFVPVTVDGVFVQFNASVPAEEKKAYQAVFQNLNQLNKENRTAGIPTVSVGVVHAYLLAPDGKPMDSLHVAEAKPDQLAKMLQRAIDTLKTPSGKPLVQPCRQSVPPKADADSLTLHLTARYLGPRTQPGTRKEVEGDYVPLKPALGQERSGQWDALPAEDWIVLKKAEWTKLLPAGKVGIGTSWEWDKEVAAQFLVRFYPTTENNDLSKNRIEQQKLKATVVSLRDGKVRARIDGELKMKHTFYTDREDKNFVEARLVGYLDFEADPQRILTLRLVTDRATYGGETKRFGAALRSVPEALKG